MESKRQKTQHNNESDSLLEKESPVSLDATISLEVWKDLIFPFVGPNCFRFLGAVNKQFRSIYLEMDASFTTTYDRIFSVEQAHLFYQDMQEGDLENLCLVRHQLESCKIMARLGRQEVLEYFHAQQFAWDEGTCLAAAQGGHFALLQWLHERDCPWNERSSYMCDCAAAYGDIPMLHWLHYRGCVWDTCTCRFAAKYGLLNVLQWLRLKECPWNEETCEYAALHGHLHVIQWAHSEGCPWDKWTTYKAVMNGHVDILAFALDHDCPTDKADLCFYAAEYGQLEVLQYLHARGGFDLNKSVMALAAEKNCFEIVQWLYSVNCPWDASACSGAAKAGNLEMLQWLRARDCPWDRYVYFSARNYENILLWARENGCPEGNVNYYR